MNDHIFLAFAAGALAHFQAVQMDLALGFLEVEIEGDALTVVKKLHAIREDKYEIREQSSTSISYRGHKERSIDLSDTRGAFVHCYCGGKGLVVDGSARLGRAARRLSTGSL
ncbi:hypothetical protein GOBAR_AA16283 [Gossypium barbadense]|uniref:RNase H type-1 domain-containing protein n=1 Tax=Gossypium barbadense TaxID=3634 RepID=A0A2P5XLZ3_GOSBA|nr:hypothetical protein GOBAR_AA16283 [Gossypium barbadense]